MTNPQGSPQHAHIAHREGDGPADHPGGSDQPVSIVLSKVQVDRVMRRASGENGHLSAMLYGLVKAREAMMASLDDVGNRHLSRSLLAGLLLLSSFPEDGEYLGNAEVARLLGMNASTAHRYISTLVEVGLLERDPSTRRYRLAR